MSGSHQQTDYAGEDTALKSPAAHARFWPTAALVLALDLWSKHWAFTRLDAQELKPLIPGWIVLRRSLNDGAVFGSFTGQTALFVAASLLALGFVFYLFANSLRRSKTLHVALGLIVAGALGNLHDRAFVQADVVDFTNHQGQAASLIGQIIGDANADSLVVGSWPDSAHPQRFKRAEVHVRRQGVVRDFIKFEPRFPSWVPKLGGCDVWPWVFNLADAALVCGVATLMLLSLFDRRPKRLEKLPEQSVA